MLLQFSEYSLTRYLILLTDDRHVGVLHEGKVARRDGDLAQVGAGEVDLHVLDHHAGLVWRRDLKEMQKTVMGYRVRQGLLNEVWWDLFLQVAFACWNWADFWPT